MEVEIEQEMTNHSRIGTEVNTRIGSYSADTGSMIEPPACGLMTLAFRGMADR